MRVKDLFNINVSENFIDGAPYPYEVIVKVDFDNEDFQRMVLSFAMNYNKHFICTDRTFPWLFPKRWGKYFMAFMDLDKAGDTKERSESLKEYTRRYELLDTMVDIPVHGYYRMRFDSEEMAKEAAEKVPKLMGQEIKQFNNDAYFRYKFNHKKQAHTTDS